MPDVLIQDVPDSVLAALDAHASRLGLSRVEYIRRRLAADARTTHAAVSVEDLVILGQTCATLGEDEHIARARR